MSDWRSALAKDMERLKWGLLYALVNGGNLPPNFIKPRKDEDE